MQLGGLEPDGALQEAQELLEGDTRRPKHSWQAPFAEEECIACAKGAAQMCIGIGVFVKEHPSHHAQEREKDHICVSASRGSGGQHEIYCETITWLSTAVHAGLLK